VLQCLAVCCSALQCDASAHRDRDLHSRIYTISQCVAVRCSALQCDASAPRDSTKDLSLAARTEPQPESGESDSSSASLCKSLSRSSPAFVAAVAGMCSVLQFVAVPGESDSSSVSLCRSL